MPFRCPDLASKATAAGISADRDRQDIVLALMIGRDREAIGGRELAAIKILLPVRAGSGSAAADVWMKDLVSGRETALTATSVHKEQAEECRRT